MIYAWHRISPQAEWRIVADGETLDQAHTRLIEALRDGNQNAGDRLMTSGKHPSDVLKEEVIR